MVLRCFHPFPCSVSTQQVLALRHAPSKGLWYLFQFLLLHEKLPQTWLPGSRHGRATICTQGQLTSQWQRCLSPRPHNPTFHCAKFCRISLLAVSPPGRLLAGEPHGLGSRPLTCYVTLCKYHFIPGPLPPAQSKEMIDHMPSECPS